MTRLPKEPRPTGSDEEPDFDFSVDTWTGAVLFVGLLLGVSAGLVAHRAMTKVSGGNLLVALSMGTSVALAFWTVCWGLVATSRRPRQAKGEPLRIRRLGRITPGDRVELVEPPSDAGIAPRRGVVVEMGEVVGWAPSVLVKWDGLDAPSMHRAEDLRRIEE